MSFHWKSVAFAVVAFAALGGPALAERTLKLSLYVPLDSLQGKAAANFKKIVETRSNNTLKINLFPSNQLGGPYEVIDSQTAGAVEMSLLGYDIYAKFSKTLTLAGMGFIFKDRAHAFKFYDSPLHEQAKAEILKQTGIRVIGNSEWNQGPYKILMAREAILKPDGLKGMPMRVPNNDIDLLVWGKTGVGASTTPVPWPEAQLALKQGLVRSIELPADFVRPFKFHESAKFLVLTEHRHQLVYMAISNKVWESLNESERDILETGSRDAGLAYTESVLKGWEEDQAFLKKQGVVIIGFDMTPWHETIVKLARDLETKGTWEKGLVDKVMGLAN